MCCALFCRVIFVVCFEVCVIVACWCSLFDARCVVCFVCCLVFSV